MESLLPEDIIIKCSLKEMVRAFFNDYVIVWHDPNMNFQENQQYMAQLKRFCELLTFTEWQKAKEYIQTTKSICHVITSVTNGELLIKEISSSQNVANVYGFCGNKDQDFEWAKMDAKVSCVESEIEKILEQIEKNLLKWYKESSSLKLTLPAFAPIFNDGDKSQMNHLHRYLKVIPNFKNREQAKKDFVILSKGIYSDKKNAKSIEEFEKTYVEYDKEAILKWFTQQSFLFKVINNSLRIATSDSIQYSRLLLKDLERAIKDQYQAKSKDFNGLLYRGCYLSDKEWSNLKNNLRREIEMHGFMSVSKEENVALKFMGIDPSKKVFITLIVPKGPQEEDQGFAEIDEFSNFPKEKEILFNVRSRFTVLETEDEYSEELPYRHLVLLYGAQGFRRYNAEKNPIEEVSLMRIEDLSCAYCNIEPDNMPDQVAFLSFPANIYYCEKCVMVQNVEGPLVCISPTETQQNIQIGGCVLINSTKTPFYGYECYNCKAEKQGQYYTCVDCSRKYCESCWKTCFQDGHRIVLETNAYSFWCEKMSETESSHLEFQSKLMKKTEVFQQPEMYFESHEYEKALKFYLAYLLRHGSKQKDENVATAYNHIGLIHQKKGQYKQAFESHKKALEVYKSVHGEDHYDVAAAYYNLGRVSYHKADYKYALHYYFKTLKIYESVYKTHHPRIATVYGSIANVYKKADESEKTLEYHNKALEIRKIVYGENHPHVASSYNDIGNLHGSQGEPEKALKYHLESLKIDKSIYGENHPNIAASYNNIGSLHNKQKKYKEALEYYSKGLDIYKSFYEENHPKIATCYNNIGLSLMNQDEYEKAEEYLLKALKIRESVYVKNHPHVATCHDNIGKLYENRGEDDKALEYYIQVLNISNFVYERQHPSVITCYLKIKKILQEQQKKGVILEERYPMVMNTISRLEVENPELKITNFENLRGKMKDTIAGWESIGVARPVQDMLITKTVDVAGGHGTHTNDRVIWG